MLSLNLYLWAPHCVRAGASTTASRRKDKDAKPGDSPRLAAALVKALQLLGDFLVDPDTHVIAVAQTVTKWVRLVQALYHLL